MCYSYSGRTVSPFFLDTVYSHLIMIGKQIPRRVAIIMLTIYQISYFQFVSIIVLFLCIADTQLDVTFLRKQYFQWHHNYVSTTYR